MLGGRRRQEKNNEDGFSQSLRHGGAVMGTGRPGRAAARGRGRPVFAAPTPAPRLRKEVTTLATSAPSARSAARAPPRTSARGPPPARAPAPSAHDAPWREPWTTPAARAGEGAGAPRTRRAGGARRAGGTARVQPRWKGVRTERAKPGAPSTPTPWSGSRTPFCASCLG